jgi:hypothetical protein
VARPEEGDPAYGYPELCIWTDPFIHPNLRDYFLRLRDIVEQGLHKQLPEFGAKTLIFE